MELGYVDIQLQNFYIQKSSHYIWDSFQSQIGILVLDQLSEEEAKKVLTTLNSLIKELIQHHPQSRISSKAVSENLSRLLKSDIWGGTTF